MGWEYRNNDRKMNAHRVLVADQKAGAHVCGRILKSI
jgi:hypothetical protein